MIKYMNFAQRIAQLEGVADAMRKTIVQRFGLPQTFGAAGDSLIDPYGAKSGFRDNNAYISVAIGSYFYLLDEVLAAFRFAPVTEFARGHVPVQTPVLVGQFELEDEFVYVLATLAFATLIGHELCHLLNGHWFMENYGHSPRRSDEIAAEAQRLAKKEHTSFAFETNADMGGITWMLETLFDETSELRQTIECAATRLPGITSSSGIGSTLAFTVVVLSKTYHKARVNKLRHPPPVFRYETLNRTAARYFATQQKEDERQAFVQVLPKAVGFLLSKLRPTNVEFAEPDEQQSNQAELAERIEEAWRDAEPFLELHKHGPRICFGAEMHDLKKTLGWSES
ncbi:MAG TPA: hypothetical protein VGN17_01855 [Bryobacteraceae bacterium]|jgi:hypothetical protein